jgi:cell volume regulation protein A
MVAYGLPTLFGGSGLLAVYIAGAVVGSGALPYRAGLLRAHDALAWLCQVTMFLLLGVLASPSELARVAGPALAVALVLAFVARPAMAALCLLPFHFRLSEVACIGWLGLRGAVPIILAIIPVLAGLPAGKRIFDVVFFVVLVSALVPGAATRLFIRGLRVEADDPPPPPASLEITSTAPMAREIRAFFVRPASAVCGATLADLPLPDGAAAILLLRGDELLPSHDGAALRAGDYVYVLCRPEDRAFVRLIFGREETD